MNGPTERALQARTIGCKSFVCYCPFYRQLIAKIQPESTSFIPKFTPLFGDAPQEKYTYCARRGSSLKYGVFPQASSAQIRTYLMNRYVIPFLKSS